jgi:hypothetical protein
MMQTMLTVLTGVTQNKMERACRSNERGSALFGRGSADHVELRLLLIS